MSGEDCVEYGLLDKVLHHRGEVEAVVESVT